MKEIRDWRQNIKRRWGIKVLSPGKLIPACALWTTRCCKTKLSATGRPTDMYDSPLTRRFYAYVLTRNLPFAIISDKYGLHLHDEELASYDVHPSVLSSDDKGRLGKEIGRKALSRGFSVIVFYNNSPLLSVPYFEMLAASNLRVLFTTQLPQLVEPSRGSTT